MGEGKAAKQDALPVLFTPLSLNKMRYPPQIIVESTPNDSKNVPTWSKWSPHLRFGREEGKYSGDCDRSLQILTPRE